jgi:hypothetical protein
MKKFEFCKNQSDIVYISNYFQLSHHYYDLRVDSPILTGMQIHHFYSYSLGLDGKTSSEACSIIIKGKNKWQTLIQNASKNNQDKYDKID